MTNAQFDTITHMLRMTSQSILVAARRVLIDGEQQTRAALDAGCDRTALVRAVGRIRDAHQKILNAYITD